MRDSTDAAATSPAVVREATPRDNVALLALDAACLTGAAADWTIRHEPDFFALYRVAGVRAHVGLAECDGALVGVVTVIEQQVVDDDRASTAWYVSGWQVHPAYRGRGIGPRLARWAFERCTELGGSLATGWFLSADSGRGMRALVSRLAPGLDLSAPRVVRSYWLHTTNWRVLVGRGARRRGLIVRPAGRGDIDEMADLWQRVAPTRLMVPALDAGAFERWRSTELSAPPACYWVARTTGDELLGFMGLWDQRPVKQFRHERWSLWSRGRTTLSRAPRISAGHRAGDRGTGLPCLAATHCCLAPNVTGVWRGLLARAARAALGAGYLQIAVMADSADPLARACDGWAAAGRPFLARVGSWPGSGRLAHRDDRTLHIDVGLA